MTEAQFEAKFKEMQKYVPFVQRVIDKLKVSNEQQGDNPRKAQLQKMEMLHDLLTNRTKKIRLETLVKCEGVIVKLQTKIEKQSTLLQSEDSVLNNVKLKESTTNHSTDKANVLKLEDDLGPASPPPEIIDLDQPVEIPTERRCSPILVKKIVKDSPDEERKQHSKQNVDIKALPKSQHSTSREHFHKVREKVFSSDNKHISGTKENPKPQYWHYNAKEHHQRHTPPPTANRQNSALPIETHVSTKQQKLQTVKVVITEPLPNHVKLQHFPSANRHVDKSSSICLNNLKTLPRAIEKPEETNEAYNPEESWELYNESQHKRPTTTSKTPPIFSRLGGKITEDPGTSVSSLSKTPGRYTPIPDVLKNPPLSNTDITNLLLESGVEKISNDISEIGTRRQKVESGQMEQSKSSPNNSFEFVRKKLAQSARISSPLAIDKDERIISPLPNERIALKYNPHPRQERLQSMSSTDGSECSAQNRVNDSRIKFNSPTQMLSPNVNVLPAINLSDPRLKKQNLPLLNTPPSLRNPVPTTPSPSGTSTPVIGFFNPSPYNYGSRKDPRISRAPNHPLEIAQTAAPVPRRPSISQPHYSSEENWDSDEKDSRNTPNKTDPRLLKREQPSAVENRSRSMTPNTTNLLFNRRNSMSQSRFSGDKITLDAEKDKKLNSKPDTKINHSFKDSGKKKSNNTVPDIPVIPVAKPPNSDTEEDWDSDPEVASSKTNLTKTNSTTELSVPQKSVVQQLVPQAVPQPIQPSITPIFYADVSPPAFINPIPVQPPLITSQSSSYNQPHITQQYHLVGPSHNRPYPLQNCPTSNRFSSVLNDTTERNKYFESRQQKTQQPRTYKEYREARERAQAQEAALRRAADEAEAKRRAAALKDNNNDFETTKKLENAKVEGKSNQNKNQTPKSSLPQAKDNKKATPSTPAPGESTLDKMYRTQNFNSNFPKSNTSFKIPKKKTEEKNKEVITKAQEICNTKKPIEPFKTLDPASKNKTTENPENVSMSNDLRNEALSKKIIEKEKANDKLEVNKTSTSDKQTENENKEPTKECKEGDTEKDESSVQTEDTKKNSRDPRCRPKPTTKESEETLQDNIKTLGDIVITSSESEVTLKPQQSSINLSALDKFNKLTQELPPKPQRVLRRRNTMLVFDSAPLVDKEKLRKANALLFEDVHDEEKRKRKKAEEERLIARRNKHLEEMFKKTDDNCTVSTQNIITGKRRTRTTINFNETVNAINVFKHKTIRDTTTSMGSSSSTPAPQLSSQDVKSTRSFSKVKTKDLVQTNDDHDKSECDEQTEEASRKVVKETKTRSFKVKVEDIRNGTKEKSDNESSEATATKETRASKSKKLKTKIVSKDEDESDTKDDDDKCKDEESKSKTSKATRASKAKTLKAKDNAEEDKDVESEGDDTKATSVSKAKEACNEDEPLSKETDVKSIKQNKVVPKTKSNTETKNEEAKQCEQPNENKSITKTLKANVVDKTESTPNNDEGELATGSSNGETNLKPIHDNENQNCAVSSTSSDNANDDEQSNNSTSIERDQIALKKETDDNEPSSTASKSNNPTPTPEANVQVLNEIVDQILKPNADRVHILGLLGQILSEERLEVIKSLIESSNRQNEEQQEPQTNDVKNEEEQEEDKAQDKPKNNKVRENDNKDEEDGQEQDESEKEKQKTIKPTKAAGEKKIVGGKKKRLNELDRLNEDIREMFICEGVLTATGRRMCTIMAKNVDPEVKNTTKETTPSPKSEKNVVRNKKDEKLKPPLTNRPLRRSLRVCKANEDNDDDETLSTISHTTEDSLDHSKSITESILSSTDTTPQRKMPVLKPNTPIKIPEDVEAEENKNKEATKKRKLTNKPGPKSKKSKLQSESEEEVEEDDEEVENETSQTKTNVVAIKNNNVHWHNQSKFTTWCMICEKKLQANASSLHYKIHHGENYISRIAPVLLQNIKQGKQNHPIFGVKKSQKQSSWFYRCPFCLKYFNTPMSLWLEHFQNHTIEFRFECSKCHRCSNRKATIARHIKQCLGATIITSSVKLNVPMVINAHVCHLCNFIQLKRANLERHYIEQHQMDKDTVELLGYTIDLFDSKNIECITEDKAWEKEKEVWKTIEKDQQVINIEECDDVSSESEDNITLAQIKKTQPRLGNVENEQEEESLESVKKDAEAVKVLKTYSRKKTPEKPKPETQKASNTVIENEEIQASKESNKKEINESKYSKDNNTTKNDNLTLKEATVNQMKTASQLNESERTVNENKISKKSIVEESQVTEIQKNQNKKLNCEVIDGKDSVQELQDELLSLAAAQVDEDICNELKDDNITLKKQDKTNFTASNHQMEKEKPETSSVSIRKKLKHSRNEFDFVVIDEKETAQDLQDELLALAAKAAGELDQEVESDVEKDPLEMDTPNENSNDSEMTMSCQDEEESSRVQKNTCISDLISSSIDVIYQRDLSSKRKSYEIKSLEAKKRCQSDSNAFMPTREEPNRSPTIQILAQSIISIEEQDGIANINKATTMAERLSQRFKSLQDQNMATNAQKTTPKPQENALEKLVNDNLLELEKERISFEPVFEVASSSSNLIQGNVDELSKKNVSEKEILVAPEKTGFNRQDTSKPLTTNDVVTVISDDEDWEDIEIIETAPAVPSSNTGNMQKSKNKGLYQKFGILKGNNAKAKKHITPIVFMPKKKTKDKPTTTTPIMTATTSSSPSPATTTTTKIVNNSNSTLSSSNSTLTAAPINSVNHLGPKTVINLMDDLLPDSPCNDPIDLAPELGILEPLQDLNDISSLLDSISEPQETDKPKVSSINVKPKSKTVIRNISNVGYSMHSGENSFKFYCLLENCTFLYSSDSLGLETHFMCEHSQIKWNGYCSMCQGYCLPQATAPLEQYSITKEIRHMMDKHANKTTAQEPNSESYQNSSSSGVSNGEDKPKIKLRRLTGDCLSRATPENVITDASESTENETVTISMNTMLGALLVAKPKPPTKDMPPQPIMPLTEPLLLDASKLGSPIAFTNENQDFIITGVTSAACMVPKPPLQISNVMTLSENTPTATQPDSGLMPKISSVCTLAQNSDNNLWSQQIENDRQQLLEAGSESQEVSSILANAEQPQPTSRILARSADDSPVIVAETVPFAQAQAGDFVVTQTVSAQYKDNSSAHVGFNISIAASGITSNAITQAANPQSTQTQNLNSELPTAGLSCSTNITSRQYKCMGSGCKFVSRVPVAMSDHLRFHERRNFSNKRDYLSCGFCFYCASDVEDYMKHADQYHIINKLLSNSAATSGPANSLTKKIQDMLNNSNTTIRDNRITQQRYLPNTNSQQQQVQDTPEVYLKKLKETIEEITKPTGLADDKLYRCMIKNCQTQLNEATFLSHILFHITTTGGNPNNYCFKCPHCPTQYQRPGFIKVHIKSHARNRYFCYLCDETSTNPDQLRKHFSEKHWHTLDLYSTSLLNPKPTSDGTDGTSADSSYYVVYSQQLTEQEVRVYGEKLILEWQRKKSGSKTHFKSSEIDLLPLSAIFQREVNCGECEYKTKVRTNMYRHLLMHKQNPGLNKTGVVAKVSSVDPVNPVPCLNSNERFFDKMTNLASSSLIPSTSSSSGSALNSTTKSNFKFPYVFVDESKRFTCGCTDCNYVAISEDLFRTHLNTLHNLAQLYCCPFCQEEICKKHIIIDRIITHLRFHGVTLFRCEECNYIHYLRYVVERHINEKHATLKTNILIHDRSSEENTEGTTRLLAFTGRKYKENSDDTQTSQTSATVTRSSNSESSGAPKPSSSSTISSKSKQKWVCDVCGHKTTTLPQMQTHCQQQHGMRNQYKCAHCSFGSQQLSQILSHIDEKHSGKTRVARYMYHKSVNNEEVVDTRPLWQRNDPTRVRNIRGILMEDEEESEKYRKKLQEHMGDDDDDDEEDELINNEDEDNTNNFLKGYEFACYHCNFNTQSLEDLKNKHYSEEHNTPLEMSRPFWYRLTRRMCCPECRSFVGNNAELSQHLQKEHKIHRFCAADITVAENDDPTQRILCAFCTFHCLNVDQLQKHHVKEQHWSLDIRIDNDDQIKHILSLGQTNVSYQCTLCSDIFSNRVAIVQHACNEHGGEESFSFRELSNTLIYRCSTCCFTSTVEMDLLKHMVDHYSRFKICRFCREPQTSFNGYMQHCYAEHRFDIQNFKNIFPLTRIKLFLDQLLIIFPNGLVVNKGSLRHTKYGKLDVIEELYDDMCRISQQPPIPRLSIARLVARKSIEAQQRQVDIPSSSTQTKEVEALQTQSQSRPNSISKRRRTVAISREDLNTNNSSTVPKPKITIVDSIIPATIIKRRTTVDHENLPTKQKLQKPEAEFNVPSQQLSKISKRRRTVAVDRETLFSSNLSSNTLNSLLIPKEAGVKKRKTSNTQTPSPTHINQNDLFPQNLDLEPFSFYGQSPEIIDLTQIYTKVAIGGIKTPLTIDKFKQLFNIECQLKLTKCDEDNQLLDYNNYKHIKKACPASHKNKFNKL